MTDKQVDLPPNYARYAADGSLIINIRVQARSSRLAVGNVKNGRLRLRLTAPPVDGKANQQAIKLLARLFAVAPSQVELVRGKASRDKSFRIINATRIPPNAFIDACNSSGGNT
ncbi:MAG: DUF167 domain-containing protein [Gammaproteobacteria bacterium]|nr:DUF167 domain-containing protein [Gammaproteobacteria bacterium]MDP7296852.1 DUF167 domain-containing protein [Gammaproteobacteria bacterium]MDP7418988.1 DUF167 domain-containing protein [Gammaproteobacteria bacterium]MDP7660046.1 DUF167 domain-containing protein [Gammaproteobacteria bacterium]HJP38447.1 DUF167 domain-containing protein [Gammaproteobacteria bacterium]